MEDTHPFRCETCEKRYTRKHNLNNHSLAAHTAVKQYICNYGCAKSFATNDLRRAHEVVHTKSKTHRCHVSACDKTFLRSHMLYRHMRTVHKLAVVPGTLELTSGRQKTAPQPDTGQISLSITELLSFVPMSTKPISIEPKGSSLREAMGSDSWRDFLQTKQYSDAFYEHAWFMAAEVDNPGALEYLYKEHKIGLNCEKVSKFNIEGTALDLAIWCGSYKSVIKLVALGAHSLTYLPDCETVLMKAVENNWPLHHMENLLQIPTVNVWSGNYQRQTALHFAAMYPDDDPSYLRFLLDHGANISTKDDTGATPLHYASSNRHPACVSFLLSRDITLMKHVDNRGRTALHHLGLDPEILTENPRRSVAFKTLEAMLNCPSVEINALDDEQNTPLQTFLDGASLFIEDMIRRNICDDDDVRSFHEYINMARKLLEHGATVDNVNAQGKTVLDTMMKTFTGDSLVKQRAEILNATEMSAYFLDRRDSKQLLGYIDKAIEASAGLLSSLLQRGAKSGMQILDGDEDSDGDSDSSLSS